MDETLPACVANEGCVTNPSSSDVWDPGDFIYLGMYFGGGGRYGATPGRPSASGGRPSSARPGSAYKTPTNRTSASGKGRKQSQGLFAQMDLTGVVGTLESHWVVLEAELVEIRKDAASIRTLTAKYGEHWSRSAMRLKKLREHKEGLLNEIKFQMELFNLHIQQGRDLCAKLSQTESAIRQTSAQMQSQLSIEVASPILANSQNPLTLAR